MSFKEAIVEKKVGGNMSSTENLPPELAERINTSKRRCFSGCGMLPPRADGSYTPPSLYSGGWMPYNSMTRKGGRMTSEGRVVGNSRAAALTNNPSVMHTSETAHWLNRNSVRCFVDYT